MAIVQYMETMHLFFLGSRSADMSRKIKFIPIEEREIINLSKVELSHFHSLCSEDVSLNQPFIPSTILVEALDDLDDVG